MFRWNRDFAIFFCTQGVSNIGDAARNILIPLYVLQLTHEPLQVSAVAALEAVTLAVLRVPLGALSDARERRRLMIVADVARTVLTLAIPLTSVFGGPVLAVIYAVIVPVTAASALFESGAGGAVPQLVPQEDRGMAYAWREGFESLAWVIGPPIGALLATLIGTGGALGIDSATFLVSVIGLVAIRARFEPDAETREQRLWQNTKDGLRLIVTHPVLRRDQIVWGLYSVLGGSIVLGLLYIGSHNGHKDTVLASIAVAVYAAGSVGGTMLAGAFEPKNFWHAMAASLGVAAVGAGLIATEELVAVLVGAALFGFGEGLLLVFHLTLRANATPENFFGRVTGVSGVIGQLAGGLSVVWLGLVLQFAHGRSAFFLLGAGVLVIGLWVALARKPAVAAASEDEARPVGARPSAEAEA